MFKKILPIIIIILILVFAAGGYWLYTKNASKQGTTSTKILSSPNETGNIFSPLAGDNVQQSSPNPPSSFPTGTGTENGTTTSQNTPVIAVSVPAAPPVPTLRELSDTPVGGMAASTTATTTIVRWVDRGTGYIYEADSDSLVINELSNTTVPMIYQSYWNNNLSAFLFQSLNDGTNAVTNFYTVISPVSSDTETSASTSLSAPAPYELHGAALPSDIAAIATNPERTSVLTFAVDGTGVNTTGTGYISQFNGSKRAQIFSTPLTQVNIDWPTDSTVTLTTKGYSTLPGFLYFVNTKTGAFTNILGNIPGLDTLTNHDASQVLYSASTGNSLNLSVYDVKAGTSQSLAFNTLPEKCVWSNLNKDDLVCAVPSQIPSASYPEAWYQGSVSFSDSLWVIDVSTGEVHKIADLLSLAGEPIDAENLTLDPQENYLYFINKRDLTLWSVGLND